MLKLFVVFNHLFGLAHVAVLSPELSELESATSTDDDHGSSVQLHATGLQVSDSLVTVLDLFMGLDELYELSDGLTALLSLHNEEGVLSPGSLGLGHLLVLEGLEHSLTLNLEVVVQLVKHFLEFLSILGVLLALHVLLK